MKKMAKFLFSVPLPILLREPLHLLDNNFTMYSSSSGLYMVYVWCIYCGEDAIPSHITYETNMVSMTGVSLTPIVLKGIY